ncbi:MAG: NlpC/P60 family protein [Actinomycetota bacterium]|nr:NlpC/P60 family protein [Actinomycetota bacterium]
MHKKFNRLKRLAIGTTAIAAQLTATAITTTTAGADQLSSAKAQAASIASKISNLNNQVNLYSEAYDQANLQLSNLNQQIAASQSKINSTESQIAGLRRKLAIEAINFYTQGGSVVSFASILNGSSTDITLRNVYAGTVANSQQTLILQFSAAQASLKAEKQKLAQQQSQVQQELNAAAQSKRDAQNAMAQAQSQLSSVNANISALVIQAQQQQAAAQAAAAAAAQKRAEALILAQQQAQRQAQQQAQQQAALQQGQKQNQQSSGIAPTLIMPPAPPVGAGASRAVAVAMSELGKPYVFGASGPYAFDCSGFAMYAWGQAGVSLPHNAAAQYDSIPHVSLSQLQPGDLVFYFTPIDHVAIYIGGGNVVVADNPSYPIAVRSLYWDGTPVGAGRP